MYWFSPQAWGIRAAAVNQYTNSRFNVCVYEDIDYSETYGMTMSEYSLTTFDVPTGRVWLYLGIVYLVGLYVFFMLIAWAVLEYGRTEDPINVSFESSDDGSNVETSASTGDYTLVATPRAANTSASGNVSIPLVQMTMKSFTPVILAFKEL
ncbi:hypothetical protein PI126_g23522 [Phytophthora idaei]|nr:hypothetical protein PI126_g23522 [Phytophthora idaei]